jgi:hypothetical protein
MIRSSIFKLSRQSSLLGPCQYLPSGWPTGIFPPSVRNLKPDLYCRALINAGQETYSSRLHVLKGISWGDYYTGQIRGLDYIMDSESNLLLLGAEIVYFFFWDAYTSWTKLTNSTESYTSIKVVI